MFKKLIVFTFIFLLLAPFISLGQEKLTVTFFHSSHCRVCIKIKNEVIPPLVRKYHDKVEWIYLSTFEEKNLSLLDTLAERFKAGESSIPTILVGNSFLVGGRVIKENLDKKIEEALEKKVKNLIVRRKSIVEIFQKMSPLVIVASGLMDGINPCAFAVIVFFVSFLAVYGYRRREIILVGSSYCLTVFVTYFLLGLGLFRFLYAFSGIHTFIQIFYYFVAFFCFLLAFLAGYDYFKYKKSGQSQGLILQLPAFLKKRINLVIGSKLREKKDEGALNLIISSVIVGFLVSLLEAVCTGQIYVPIVVAILKYPHLRLKAFSYLFLYNLMFIFPLILIFVLSIFGFGSQKFDRFLKKHLGAIKILMVLLFIALGVFVLGYNHIYAYLSVFFKKMITQLIKLTSCIHHLF